MEKSVISVVLNVDIVTQSGAIMAASLARGDRPKGKITRGKTTNGIFP